MDQVYSPRKWNCFFDNKNRFNVKVITFQAHGIHVSLTSFKKCSGKSCSKIVSHKLYLLYHHLNIKSKTSLIFQKYYNNR